MALIEQEALIKAIENDCQEQTHYTKKDAIECVLCMPVIDAAPVVHGRWNPGEDEDPEEADCDHYNWTCSACHEEICYIDPTPYKHLPHYCPNCGARMGGAAGGRQ